jgi:hypothetical protein
MAVLDERTSLRDMFSFREVGVDRSSYPRPPEGPVGLGGLRVGLTGGRSRLKDSEDVG